MKRLFVTSVMLLFLVLQSIAQNPNAVEMADTLRSSGKIYVVVAVMSVVFIGIAIYLFTIDNRLKKIEKQKGM